MIVDDKLMKYVLFQKRTVQEVRNKCHQLGISEEEIEEIIAYLIENGYLDDELYTMKYILNVIRLKKKSKQEIRFDLLRKGVADEIIQKYIETEEVETFELRCAMELAQKKYKECHDILKVKKFLSNKGYSSHFIHKAIDTLQEISNNNSREIF